MRVSRTRFSKRRSKRKTSFPVVAVVKKKIKPKYNVDQSFSIFGQEENSKAFNIRKDKAPSGQNAQSKVSQVNQKNNSTFDLANAVSLQSKSFDEKNVMRKKSLQNMRTESHGPVKKSAATIDYKNVVLLRKLITAEGRILPRRINKLTAKQQRYTAKAIKSARVMGLLPFINKSRPLT